MLQEDAPARPPLREVELDDPALVLRLHRPAHRVDGCGRRKVFIYPTPCMSRTLILCSQGKWGRGGVPRSVLLGFLFPVRGCATASNLPSPWERPGVGSKDILLPYLTLQYTV